MVAAVLRPFQAGSMRLAGAVLALLLLAGCAADLQTERIGTVYPATLQLMDSLDMDRAAPILVRLFKEDDRLELWKQDRSGRYRLLKTYDICRYSGALGPKKAAGDHQAPEGFYEIGPGQMNPHSREYLAFNIGYPNSFDRSLGRTGDSIMVHGGCRSVGCYAMTNEQIEEIYGLAHEAFAGGQRTIQFQAYPFRMTESNLIRHEGDPNIDFWRMLKAGSDLFAATGLPPRVAVCNQRYVFDAATAADDTRNAALCSASSS